MKYPKTQRDLVQDLVEIRFEVFHNLFRSWLQNFSEQMQGNPWWCYRSSSETTRHFCCRDLIGWKSRPCGGTLPKREESGPLPLLFLVNALHKSYEKKSDWSKSELRKIDARKFKTFSANIRKRQNLAYFVIRNSFTIWKDLFVCQWRPSMTYPLKFLWKSSSIFRSRKSKRTISIHQENGKES